MNRRQYLARTGAAGASLGTVTALAGCLDDFGESSEAPDVEVDDRAGERAIDRAAGRLNKAAQALNDLDGVDDPEAVEFDETEPQAQLEDARGYLETAAAELGEDRTDDVELLRSYADAVEGLVSVTVTVTDDTFADDIDEVNEALEEDGDIEGASEMVDERHGSVTMASERHGEASATLGELDGDRLNSLTGTDIGTLEDGANTLGDVVTSLETLTGAYDSTLDPDAGYGALDTGRDQFDAEEYERARASFQTAETTFVDSHRRLDDGSEDAPSGLADYFETAVCQTEHLTAAAGHFVDAADAANDRRLRTAETKRAEGEAELDEIPDCSD